jgi:hypothetical protein
MKQQPQTSRSGWLKNGNPTGDLAKAMVCGARTRSGKPCRGPAMKNGLRHVDEINQTAGRNLGFRHNGIAHHHLVMGWALYGEMSTSSTRSAAIS